MKLTRIQQFKKLSEHLHEHERESFEVLLEGFAPGRKGEYPSALAFWKLLQANEDAAAIDFALTEYFGKPAKVSRVARQVEKMYTDNLLLGTNIEAEGAYSEVAQKRIKIEQQLQFAHLLVQRELLEEALDLLEELEGPARTFELYGPLLGILYKKQEICALLGFHEQFEAIDAETEFYELCRVAMSRAKKAYYKAIHNYGFKGNSHSTTDPQRLRNLETDLQMLEADFKTTSSAMVGFYFLLLRVEWLQLQQDFATASQSCLELLDLVRNNPSVYHVRRVGMAYLNLSQNELFNHYFDYALGFAQQAQEYFQPGSRNHQLALELEFYALFYDGKTRSAAEVLDTLTSDDGPIPAKEEGDFRAAWRNYLMACAHFIQQDFRKVHRALHSATLINKDKEGWNLGTRILTVMNLLELNLKDHADYEIDNLRSFTKRGLKDAPVRQRDRLIVELFTALKKSNYNYAAIAYQQQQLLQRLSSSHASLAWKVQTPELIAVHKWFEAKIDGGFYVPNYSIESLFRDGDKRA